MSDDNSSDREYSHIHVDKERTKKRSRPTHRDDADRSAKRRSLTAYSPTDIEVHDKHQPRSRYNDERGAHYPRSRGDRTTNGSHHDHHKLRGVNRSRSRSPMRRQSGQEPTSYQETSLEPYVAVDKQKPNFQNTGRLAAAANTVQTAGQKIILKYHEPNEARKPPRREAWRMYCFKDDEIMDTVELHEQSCWLFGREIAVADVPLEHPSCSKQHAALQFRYVEKRNEFGDKVGKVRPYAIDLESSHGTTVNEERIPEAKYYELRDKDVLRFGKSRREYVVQLPSREKET